jgi:cyclase|tara:strand:+ start:183 stop:293 length:111 start_codon:yes stop_codon:yes gene_type:complete
MKKVRIISRLDIKNDIVVKGIHLEGLRVVGKPGEMA